MAGKQIIQWLWIPVILVFLYAGWVIYSRWASNRDIAAEAQQERAEQDQKILDKLGAGRLKILMFYANPPAIRRGDTMLLCYGVSNAKSARIEPAVDGVGPALSRCVEAKPAANTTYTLIAQDEAGAEIKSTVEVQVQ